MQTKPDQRCGNHSKSGAVAKYLTLIVTLVIILAASVPALAADVREILSARAYHHLLETDDFFLLVHYNITHDVDPGITVDEYYHFRLMSADELTQYGAAEAYPYYSDGYGEGVVGFYWSAADAPVWGGAYVLRLEGNPEHFAIPPVIRYTLTSADYSTEITQADSQAELGQGVIDIALSLQTDWTTELVVASDLGMILGSTGEAYFRGSIDGLSYMAPGIFAVQSSTPTVTPRVWGTATADAYQARWAGTWVANALDGASDMFGGISWGTITSMMLLILVVAVFGISFWLFQTSLPGFVAGAIILLMGFVMGFVSAGIMGVAALVCALYLGYILIFRHG